MTLKERKCFLGAKARVTAEEEEEARGESRVLAEGGEGRVMKKEERENLWGWK